ncbi:acetyl-CoA carboxylase carboxyltransferase subunit beta [bacterium]|nr:acetyl-CoA carboxylase carboxyltransferase subunit beta [bacterium]
MTWFSRPKRYTKLGRTQPPEAEPPKKKDIPEGVMTKCPSCGQLLYTKNLEENNNSVCYLCDYHFRIDARRRLALLVDAGSFVETDAGLVSADPLRFLDYARKVEATRRKTGLADAVICGVGEIRGRRAVVSVSDFNFMGGSMGSVVGEKVTRALEHALEAKLPAVSVSAGGGGARMHEGMLSLMQMAKTSAAAGRLKEAGIPFISIFTDPTMGGVAASYASLGDVLIAEPGAMIGFAGPRVIEQTIHRRLPEGFQRAEFLLEHGMLDMICHRSELKDTVAELLDLLWYARAALAAARAEAAKLRPRNDDVIHLPKPAAGG